MSLAALAARLRVRHEIRVHLFAACARYWQAKRSGVFFAKAKKSAPAPRSSAVVFLTQSARDFLQFLQPSGNRLSTNIAWRSLTAIVGSPSTCLASDLLARKANSKPNSPAAPTRLSSPSNLVSLASRSR